MIEAAADGSVTAMRRGEGPILDRAGRTGAREAGGFDDGLGCDYAAAIKQYQRVTSG